MATVSAAVQRRRRSGPLRTSIGGLVLVIITTVSLPLSSVGSAVCSIRGLQQLVTGWRQRDHLFRGQNGAAEEPAMVVWNALSKAF